VSQIRNMGNVELCKRELREVVEFAPREKLRSEAQKRVNLLDRRRRAALKPWAMRELESVAIPTGNALNESEKALRKKALRWSEVLRATLDAIEAV
jgi:hypothetical protein